MPLTPPERVNEVAPTIPRGWVLRLINFYYPLHTNIRLSWHLQETADSNRNLSKILIVLWVSATFEAVPDRNHTLPFPKMPISFLGVGKKSSSIRNNAQNIELDAVNVVEGSFDERGWKRILLGVRLLSILEKWGGQIGNYDGVGCGWRCPWFTHWWKYKDGRR